MLHGLVMLALVLAPQEDTVSQGTWTLEQCIERGLSEGIELWKQDLQVRQASESKRLAALDYLPELNLSAMQDYNWGRSVDMQELKIVKNGMNISSSLSTSASISSGSLISAAFATGERRAALNRATSDRDDIRTSLMIEITQAYLQLLLTSRMCENAQANYSNITLQRDRVIKEVKAGKVPYGSLFEMEAQAASERETLAEAIGKRNSARIALSKYLNLKPEENLEISPPADDRIPSPSVLPTECDIAAAIEVHPKIRSAEAAVAESGFRRKSAFVGLMPELSVTGLYNTSYSDRGDGDVSKQLHDNWNPAISIGVNIPILSGSGSILKYRNSVRETASLQMEKEKCRRELSTQMREALAEARNSYEVYIAATENMSAMEKSFHVNEARFNAGMISGSEYLICRNNFHKAVAQYWVAKYKYLFQLKVIDYRMGLKMEFE